ncbi:MAG: hypothetical protein QOE68_1982 [Thermoanaerobaculia bacterium]|jgi:hypothetical protein|nr:hypothetical protein [Thermoanaerobaculia bacterium]
MAWLRCEVHPGIFSDEVAVGVMTAEGTLVSFFLQDDLVKNHEIAVGVVARNGEYGVVMLPQRTFEGSNVARVPMGSLRFA